MTHYSPFLSCLNKDKAIWSWSYHLMLGKQHILLTLLNYSFHVHAVSDPTRCTFAQSLCTCSWRPISFVSRHRGGEERTERARLPQTTGLLQGELWDWIPGNWLRSRFFSTFVIPLISFFLSFPPAARGADNFQSSSLPALTAKCLQIYIGAHTAISAWRALGAACRGPCPFKRTEGQQR